ncbi:MAG: hypothetical protein IKA33_00045 [Candidatus Methanomethylophilaceae archaeon]|nr:hypothetical protein [Candidatus Methanomethylophilaceae archaeon]
MSGKDFLDAFDQGTDRIPTFLRDMTLGMDIIGCRTTDIFGPSFDAELSPKSIVAFQRFTGQDAVIGCTHSAAFIIEQFGGTMRYPEYGIPVPVTHPLDGMTDFSGCDVTPKGKLVSAIESYGLVRSSLPDIAIVGNVTGPFTKAGVLTGMEYLSMLTISEGDVLDHLLDMCLEKTRLIIEGLCKDTYIDAGLIAAATDNPDLFGLEAYRDVSIPYTKRISDILHEYGLPVIYHPHGTFAYGDTNILDITLDAGYDGFHYPENNDLSMIHDSLKDRTCILGGTDIVPTLLNGDDDMIRKETVEHLDTFNDCRYVFMASCSLHRGLGLDSIRTMMDTVRSF